MSNRLLIMLQTANCCGLKALQNVLQGNSHQISCTVDEKHVNFKIVYLQSLMEDLIAMMNNSVKNI